MNSKSPVESGVSHEKSSTISPGTRRSRRLRVLVVEDDVASCLLLVGLLSKYADCQVARNGKEALDFFQANRRTGKGYDLICMDIQMPEMDGHEAVSEIRAIEKSQEIHAGVKILMTTSHRDVKTIFASYQAKCDGYLTKPFDAKMLDQRLKLLGLI